MAMVMRPWSFGIACPGPGIPELLNCSVVSLGRKVAKGASSVANKVQVEEWVGGRLLAGNGQQLWWAVVGGGCAVGSAMAGVRDV